MVDGRWKLPPVNLLASAWDRNWSGIGAELRRHSPGEVPEMIADRTVVGLAVKDNPASVVHRHGNGTRQATPAATETVWLCPSGVAEDSIRITDTVPENLHLYLPSEPFSALSREDHDPAVTAESVRYEAGLQEHLISEIGRTVLRELAMPTSSEKLLVETAGLMLAPRLVHDYSSMIVPFAARTPVHRGLDAVRLRRVLDFVDANLETRFGVRDLACIACLSEFHFCRAFRRATGHSPHSFVSERRLEWAKSMLAGGTTPPAEIALICSFSSQANFTRAFKRATGLSPGLYRQQAR